MTRTRRSAQELIEESEVRLAKLREKAALDQAKQSPELAPIVEAIQENTAAEDLAELILAQAQERKEYLSSSLASLSQSILDGNDVAVDILETLASIPASPLLEDATIKYGLAHNSRKSLSTSTLKESSNDQPL